MSGFAPERQLHPLDRRPSWRARWIAPGDVTDAVNVVFRARTALDLDAVPGGIRLHLSADAVYRLWVNGEAIGRGPVRGSRTLAFYDSYELGPWLRPGRNHLALLVWCPVEPTKKYACVHPALLVQVEDAAGRVLAASGDPGWEVAPAADFRRDTPWFAATQGRMQWQDLRLEPRGWTTGEGADGWSAPQVVAAAGNLGGKRLQPRDIAPLVVRALPPVGCPLVAAVPAAPGAPDNVAELLAGEHHRVLGLDGTAFPLELPADAGGTCLIWDFGTPVTAGVEIELEAPAGSVLDLGYGEHLVDGRLRTAPRDKPNLRYADRYVLPGGRTVVGPTLPERGTRYLQAVLRGSGGPLRIHRVRGIDRRHPLPPLAPLPDLDPELRAIAGICRETIHACATDTLIDCPGRESAFWVNDFVVEAPVWLAAGGDPALIARCLRLAYSQVEPGGLVPAVCPTNGYPRLAFPATNAYLPLVLRDYLARVDDPDLVGELAPAIRAQQRGLDALRRDDGLIVAGEVAWNFVDWSLELNGHSLDRRCSASVNWFAVLGLQAWAAALDRLGERAEAARERARAVDHARAAQAAFWDPRRGGYREWEGDDAPCTRLAAALALLAGHLTPPEERQSLAALTDADQLDPELFMQHFVLQALAAAGRRDEAVAIVRRWWGPIVAAGSPTVWEAGLYPPGTEAWGGIASLCHGFGAGPLVLLAMVPDEIRQDPSAACARAGV